MFLKKLATAKEILTIASPFEVPSGTISGGGGNGFINLVISVDFPLISITRVYQFVKKKLFTLIIFLFLFLCFYLK